MVGACPAVSSRVTSAHRHGADSLQRRHLLFRPRSGLGLLPLRQEPVVISVGVPGDREITWGKRRSLCSLLQTGRVFRYASRRATRFLSTTRGGGMCFEVPVRGHFRDWPMGIFGAGGELWHCLLKTSTLPGGRNLLPPPACPLHPQGRC